MRSLSKTAMAAWVAWAAIPAWGQAIIEGPGLPPAERGIVEGAGPTAGAYYLAAPADYDWWNGCSPTAAGMLFGWWEEHGYDAFPGNHRNLPATFPSTSTNPADYADARGILVSWENKQAGTALGMSYGSYKNHAPNCIADFILTENSGTMRSTMAWGFKNFGAWDDPRTTTVESRRFTTNTVYTSSGWTYNDYVNEINAGRPVHLGLVSSTGGGHSVVGIGYNNTGGKQNIVLMTTWHWGVQEWEWSNENDTGSGYSVYGATLMQPVTTAHPQLSGYVSISHPTVGQLNVMIGVGDPANPTWSTNVWNYAGGSDDNLVLTDIDLSGALGVYQNGAADWFVKVRDNVTGETGTIQDFQVRYGFDQLVYHTGNTPVAILDNQNAFMYVHTVPEPGSLVLLGMGVLAVLGRRRGGGVGRGRG